MLLPRINVLCIEGLNAVGRVRVTLEGYASFETSAIEHREGREVFFRTEIPCGIFKGRICLLSPVVFNPFVPEPFDQPW